MNILTLLHAKNNQPKAGDEIATEQLAQSIGMDGSAITLSPRQQEAVNLAASGKSFVMIGAAGSGKTTTSRACIEALLSQGTIPKLDAEHKYLRRDAPGVIITSFTRRSVNNIRSITPDNLKPCCVTLHKCLEYQPFKEFDANLCREVVRFRPARNKTFTLPDTIKIVVVEEAGMVSVDLWQMFLDALPNPEDVQFIFIGDLYQLPPPMGDAILGYRGNELPVLELDRVYRQGLGSPVLELALKVKDGIQSPSPKVRDANNPLRWTWPKYDELRESTTGKVDIRCWQNRYSNYQVNRTVGAFIFDLINKGEFDPDQDIVLCPFEKALSKNKEELCSTVNINNILADYLGKQRGALVYEVIARGQKHYLAEGDKVLYDKEDCTITRIKPNPYYMGEPYREASKTLDRYGVEHGDLAGIKLSCDVDVDKLLEAMASTDGDEELRNQASHIITLDCDGEQIEISTAGDLNSLLFGYAITVYKAQGSEWRNVILVVTHNHKVSLSNEMIYTAITRAKDKIIILGEDDTLTEGVKRRRIHGKTLKEKFAFFSKRLQEKQGLMKLVSPEEETEA